MAALERLRAVPAHLFEPHKEKVARRVMQLLEARFYHRILILDREERNRTASPVSWRRRGPC